MAGTLVVTDRGMMPIEDVKVGDLVWSRDDVTGEAAFKEVTYTVVTYNQLLLQITYEMNGELLEIVVTPEHP